MSESSHISKTYLPIEDYALIGDLHTVALVGKITDFMPINALFLNGASITRD